jgi:hypothetical protein
MMDAVSSVSISRSLKRLLTAFTVSNSPNSQRARSIS